MIRGGFLSREDRADLIALARDGAVEHRLARRANALALLDDGLSCERVAEVLFLDDDTIRKWHGLFIEDGLEGLTRFEAGGSASFLSAAQEDAVKAFVATRLPRSTRQIGACIGSEFGVVYESRSGLIALARDGAVEHRLARRANALVLLDSGWSCEKVSGALLLDDDTIRKWHGLFIEDGLEGLTRFEAGGSACQLSDEQQARVVAFVQANLPRSIRQIGAFIGSEFGVAYESRSGLIALLHRLGLEYHKPEVIPRKLDEKKQRAFIELYENLLNSLADDEAALFMDAVHPTHAARPAGCWAPKGDKLAIEQTSGRQRINIHGAIDLTANAKHLSGGNRADPDDRGGGHRRRVDD